MTSAPTSRQGDANRPAAFQEPDDKSTDCGVELVGLLGDEHTRLVLENIADRPMAAKEIANETAVSQPTVYRRLEQLEEAGLVEATMVPSPDGHHHKRFQAVLETARIRLDRNGFSITVHTEDPTPEPSIESLHAADPDAAAD